MAKYHIGQPIKINKDRILDCPEETDLLGNPCIKNVMPGYYQGWELKEGQQGNILAIYNDYQDHPKLKEALSVGVSISPSETYYDVRIGLTEYRMVPESSIDGIENIKSKVDEVLAQKQAGKEFKDVGKRIGGTSKERAAYKKVLLNDLLKLEENESTAIEFVKKDRVYPKTNNQEQFDMGVTAGAAFMKQELRKVYPGEPSINSPLGRKLYVGFVQRIIDTLQQSTTLNDFKNELEKFKEGALDLAMELTDEDLYLQHKSGIQNYDQNLINLEREYKRLGDLKQVELLKLGEANPKLVAEAEALGNPHALFHKLMNLPESEQYKAYDLEMQAIRKQLNNASSGKTSAKLTILKKIFPKGSDYSLSSANSRTIIKELLGSRFFNLVFNRSESATEVYNKAFAYEPLSKHVSETLISEQLDGHRKNLEKLKMFRDFLSVSQPKEKLDAFYEHARDAGKPYKTNFHSTFFEMAAPGIKKQSWYWTDVRNSVDLILLFIQLDLQHINRQIESIEKHIKKIEELYKERESDWTWAFGEKAKKESKERKEITINSGKPLDFIKRTGGVQVYDTDVTIEFLTDTLGFKSVTLGNYVKDVEAREHVRHFIGSVFDLCEILDINVKSFTDWQGLSMWFGAAGHGKALAFYKKNGVVINITKKRGEGTIAHEMAHYIDNTLNKIDNEEYDVTAKGSFGSVTQSARYIQRNIKNRIVWQAMRNIMEYIYDRRLPSLAGFQFPSQINQNAQSEYKKTIQADEKGLLLRAQFLFTDIDTTIAMVQKRYPDSFLYIENLTPSNIAILGRLVSHFGHKEYEFTFKSKSSSFYTNSKLYGEYWFKDWELFARAFETYCFDKLAKLGRESNYLVSGEYFNESIGVYPQGLEREDLYVLYDMLFAAIRSEYALPKFDDLGRPRVDEYIALSENKEGEETSSGIVTNVEDNEVIENINKTQAIQKKLYKFLELLQE